MKKALFSLFIAALVLFSFSNLSCAGSGFRAGGGGVIFSWNSPDLGPLNREIENMGINDLDEGFFTFGGRGFGYVSRNIRIGGLGAGGNTSVSGLVPEHTVENITIPELVKEVDFSMGYGGVTLEYTRDLPFDIQLFAGGMLGWGGVSVRISQYEKSLSWGGIWGDYQQGYTGDSYDLTVTAINSIFILNPWVGVEYKVLPWMGFYGKVGYFYAIAKSGNWKVIDSKLFGAPELDLNNFNLEFAIIFGV